MSNKQTSLQAQIKHYAKEFGLFVVDILYNAVIIIVLVVFIRTFLVSPFRVVGASMVDTLQNNEFILIDRLSYHIGVPERGDPIVFKPPMTNKYQYTKFEGELKMDPEGQGVIDLHSISSLKNVMYCQNAFMKWFWFCKEGIQEGDMVYFKPANQNDWTQAKHNIVSKEESKEGALILSGTANTIYDVRIYDKEGADYFVKRIIGIPGDTIKIQNGRVYLKKINEDAFHELEEPYLNQTNHNQTFLKQKNEIGADTFTVPEGHYFVMGDNRVASNDSRTWFAPITEEHTPYVPAENISGRVLTVLWPPFSIRYIGSYLLN